MAKPKLDRPKPIDYAVMFGGPILFLGLAWIGIQSLLGPAPPVSAVQKLRGGAVKVGMKEPEVRAAVGGPVGLSDRADGGFTYRYQGSSWDNGRQTFAEEDAYVDFSSSGQVTAVTFESRVPPTSADTP